LSSKQIIAGAILLGLSSLISRLLGVYRDHLFGIMFGTTSTGIHDIGVYLTAFRIPDFLYTVLIYGAISTAFIPIFTELITKKDDKKACDFATNITNTLILFLLICEIIIFIFTPYLTKIFAAGFTGERLDLMIKLTRIMLLSPIFFGISSIFQGIQNTYKIFLYPALAPIFYNLSIIIGTLFFAKNYGIYGLAISVCIGAFLHMLIQIPQTIKLGFKYKFSINLKNYEMKRFFKLMIPRIIGLSVDQLTLIINSNFATTLSYSATTVLPYAVNIQSLPLGLFGIAVAIASFSTFSEMAANKDHEKVSYVLKQSISNILFFVIPSAIGLYIIKYDVINLIFGGGKFTQNDIILTGDTLSFLLIGLAFQSITPILARIFYSYHDTKTPLYTAIFAILINIIAVFITTKILNLDVKGIALAISLTGIFNSIILAIALKFKLNLQNFFPFKNTIKIIISSSLMGVFVYKISPLIINQLHLNFTGLILKITNLAIPISLGIILYIIFAILLKIPEIYTLLNKCFPNSKFKI